MRACGESDQDQSMWGIGNQASPTMYVVFGVHDKSVTVHQPGAQICFENQQYNTTLREMIPPLTPCCGFGSRTLTQCKKHDKHFYYHQQATIPFRNCTNVRTVCKL